MTEWPTVQPVVCAEPDYLTATLPFEFVVVAGVYYGNKLQAPGVRTSLIS